MSFPQIFQSEDSARAKFLSAGKNRELHINGAILIWGDATQLGKEQVEKSRSFQTVLTIADMCDDLRKWQCEKFWHLLDDRQRWCHEMFSELLGGAREGPT